MKVQELIIGNLLDYNGEIVKITTLCIDFNGNKTILASNENFSWHVSKIDGIKQIPLTEEWLLKFENVKKETYRIFWSNFGFDKSGYFLWVSGFKKYILYVHQLQNLYFALTGEELMLKK